MRISTLILTVFLFTSSAHGAFEDFVGCFETFEHNGRPVQPATEASKIQLVPSHPFYLSLAKEELKTLEVWIATPGFQMPVFDVYRVLVEGARVTESQNKIDILFDGVIYNTFAAREQRVNEITLIEKVEDVFVFQTTLTSGVSYRAKMKRVDCERSRENEKPL